MWSRGDAFLELSAFSMIQILKTLVLENFRFKKIYSKV